MRWILRQLIFHLTALFVSSSIIPGFSIGNSAESIILATVTLSAINVFVKPIVKIFFLPLNLITLNLFSIVINTGLIFALTKLVPTVKINAWYFNGTNFNGFVVPPIHFTIIYTYVLTAIIITTLVNFLNWLTK